MKEKKNGIPKFWRSIAVRFALVVLLMVIAVMLVLYFSNRKTIETHINDYYSTAGDILSEYMIQGVLEYEGHISEFGNSDQALFLQNLCKQQYLTDFYIRVSEPPYEEAFETVYISKHRIDVRPDAAEFSEFVLPVLQNEKEIYQGIRESALDTYKFNNVYYLTYMHGIYDENGNCIAVCGSDVFLEDYLNDVSISVFRSSAVIAVILTAFFIGILILLYRLVIFPIREISTRMRGLVENDTIHMDKIDVKGSDELSQMAADFNTMTDEISEYIKTMQTVNAAAEIQSGMLPPPHFENELLSVDGLMKPAKNIGGDFFDYMQMPDGRMFFVIGDVSGKGISAALLMASTLTAIRHNARQYRTPAEILKVTNLDIAERNPEQLFVTVFAAFYDPASSTLTFANAGHNPPYLIRNRLLPLDQEPGLLLGLFDDAEYKNETVGLRAGDLLFLYTDGLSEAVSPEKKFLGNEGMEGFLSEASNASGKNFAGQILQKTEDFSKGEEQHDDITMLAVHFKNIPAALTLPAKRSEIGALKAFVMESSLIPEAERKKIYLAVEEIFVNICNYAYNGREPGDVTLKIAREGSTLSLEFKDGGIPYDPTADTDLDMDYDPDTSIGGLGKLLAFTIMDSTAYCHQNGFNILTLTKQIGGEKSDSE